MFHRQRQPNHVQPTMTEAQAPEPAPIMTETAPLTDPQPIQPPAEAKKEAEPMSNYTPTNNQNDAQAEGFAQPGQPQAPQMGTASFTARTPNMAPMVRSPYGYGPAYGSQEQTVSTGRKLVIGEGITLSGEIEACDHLVVEGTVEASLKGASILDVSQSGMFFGAVEINEATIAGRFEGDITVNGRLTVRATGTVTGTLSYKELAVEAGATIDGKINPMREGRAATAPEKKQQGKSSFKPITGNQPVDVANELPLAQNKTVAA